MHSVSEMQSIKIFKCFPIFLRVQLKLRDTSVPLCCYADFWINRLWGFIGSLGCHSILITEILQADQSVLLLQRHLRLTTFMVVRRRYRLFLAIGTNKVLCTYMSSQQMYEILKKKGIELLVTFILGKMHHIVSADLMYDIF